MNDFCLKQGWDLKASAAHPLKFPLNARVWGYNLKGKEEVYDFAKKKSKNILCIVSFL